MENSQSVSDQARSNPDYQPAIRTDEPGAARGFGALGTSGTPPPNATAYPPTPAADNQFLPAGPIPAVARTANGNVTAAQSAAGPLGGAPVQAVAPAAPPVAPVINDPLPPAYEVPSGGSNEGFAPDQAYAPAPQYPAEQASLAATAPPTTEARVSELEKDVQTIANAVGTVLTKLDAVLNGGATSGAPTPGMPTNTGQLTGGAPTNFMPGTATPNAPVSHTPGVQAPIPQQTGPVMPAPNPAAAPQQLPGQKRVLQISPEESNLTVAQYAEKHFRLRDQSIDEMAELLRLDPQEITDILKDLGYQFPDGV